MLMRFSIADDLGMPECYNCLIKSEYTALCNTISYVHRHYHYAEQQTMYN